MKATVSFKEFMANEISLAKEYLNNNPRKESYPVTLGSIDDDCHGIYCHHLSDEEKALIQSWQTMTEDDELYGVDLDEFLEVKNIELRDRLLANDSVYNLTHIDSCDLNDPHKFTKCIMREFNEEKDTLSTSLHISVPLTDEEYILILAAFISDPHFTMNKLIYKFPEIGCKIMDHIVNVSYNGLCENPNPFIIIFQEIEEIAKKIRRNNTDI
jgi:hypothetical protein